MVTPSWGGEEGEGRVAIKIERNPVVLATSVQIYDKYFRKFYK